VIDVGQGDCTLVRTENDHTYLIDGGSSSVTDVAKYRIVPYLKYQGIGKLDYVLVSHGDEDHINGIEEMLREDEIEIGKILLGECEKFNDSYEELLILAEESGVPVSYVRRGDVLKDGELQFTVLNPSDEAYDDGNDASMVLYLTWRKFSMCFTGDISETTEQVLLSCLSTADVLKTAHHGSKYSSSEEFLAKVAPLAATISCQKDNSYGHPHAETLNRLAASGAQIFNTAELGRIVIEVQKTGQGFSASGLLQQ
jgi:competence protein ComEC